MDNAYVGAHGKIIYVGVPTREIFDSIEVATMDHRPKSNLLSKVVESKDGVMVVFQYWFLDAPDPTPKPSEAPKTPAPLK